MCHIQRVGKERWSYVNFVPRVLCPWRVRRKEMPRYPGYEFDIAFARQTFLYHCLFSLSLSFFLFFWRRTYKLISTHFSPPKRFVSLFSLLVQAFFAPFMPEILIFRGITLAILRSRFDWHGCSCVEDARCKH